MNKNQYQKILELRKWESEDIIANLFLNYSSCFENDKIYLIKKFLSKKLNIDIKDIRLIGSAHIGIACKPNDLKIEIKENPKDLDFAIINNVLFEKEYQKIIENRYHLRDEKLFSYNYKRGKLHLKYVSKKYKIIRICNKINELIKDNLNLDLKASCCIFKNEDSFLKNQNFYYRCLFTKIKQLDEKGDRDV